MKLNVLSLGSLLGVLVTAAGQTPQAPATATPPAATPTPAVVQQGQSQPAQPAAAQATTPTLTTPAVAAEQSTPPTNTMSTEAYLTNTAPVRVLAEGEKGLKLTFQNAPLELVLNYLAKYAGFIVVPDQNVDIRGRVTAIVQDPMDKNEVVSVLNMLLNKSGYAFMREGRVLNVTRADQYPPIHTGNDFTNVPPNGVLVTQIIPVKFVDSTQLIQTLQPLLPRDSTTILTANTGGNTIVVQDTQFHIRRMMEIIKALDTPLAASSTVKVYPMLHANAKDVAQMIKDLFPATAGRGGGGGALNFGGGGGGGRGGRGGGGAGGAANPFAQLLGIGGGAGGPGGGFAAGGGGRGAAAAGRIAPPTPVATADDRSNTLIVMASDEQQAIVAEVVANIDIDVEDLTVLRVFHLFHANATDTANELAYLFPNQTTPGYGQQGGGRGGFGGAGGGFGGGRMNFQGSFGGTASSGGQQSDRLKRQTQVTAVADVRANDVIVTASKDLMVQVESLLDDLDSNDAGQLMVQVFRVDNGDPTTIAQELQSLVPSAYGSSSLMNNQRGIGTQLQTRSQNNMNNLGRTSTTAGMTGLGGGGGGGGFGGGTIGSDRNIKTNFAPVDTQAVLAKVAALPITSWNYIEDIGTLHLGPMAQDFYAAFGTGADDKHIAVVDEGGVALAAIQGLNQKLEAKDAQIKALEKELSELKALVQGLVTKSNSTVGAAPAN